MGKNKKFEIERNIIERCFGNLEVNALYAFAHSCAKLIVKESSAKIASGDFEMPSNSDMEEMIDEHAEILRTVFDVDQSKIFLIPHGARDMDPIPDAKKKLNLEDRKVILLAGYYWPAKCFDRVVDFFPYVVEKVPDAWLVLSGKLRVPEFSNYRRMLFEKINDSPARDRIEVFRGKFPQKTFDTILSAADILVLPYTAGAQSGIMTHAMTFGKPVVTSNLPAFVDTLERSKAGFYVQTDDEYVDRIVTLLTDTEVYKKFSQNALTYVKENISWDIVAHQTLTVYKQFDFEMGCKTRYVFAGE
jgi:glycosyltransferase involved in cell wall biosynthesis